MNVYLLLAAAIASPYIKYCPSGTGFMATPSGFGEVPEWSVMYVPFHAQVTVHPDAANWEASSSNTTTAA
jgi:hypothetical protein